MTVSRTVAPGEGGRLRLYQLSPTVAGAASLRAAFADDDPARGAQVGAALGTGPLDPHWLTLAPVSDLQSIGFETYLRAGHDVPEAQLKAVRPALEAAEGHVLIVQSPAFQGAGAALSPADWLTPLAEFDTIRDPGPLRRTAPPAGAAPAPAEAEPGPARRRLPAPVLLGALLAAGALVAALALLGGR